MQDVISSNSSVSVADVVEAVSHLYPPHLAESWDSVGLVCGDPDAEVRSILVAVDPTPDVAAEAVKLGVDLLLVHHPLLFSAVNSVAATEPRGQVITDLIRSGCALLTAHTNADAANPGVSDALAELLGVRVERALVPAQQTGQLLVTYIPETYTEEVIDAVSAAGAGRIGDYNRCAFTQIGSGTFDAPQAGEPFIGQSGERTSVQEMRLEMSVPPGSETAAVAALLEAHPYEEVAYSLIPVSTVNIEVGLGRVGTLNRVVTLAEFADRVATTVPRTATGIRVAGNLDAPVGRVAVCGGSGGEFLALTAGCDVYVTSDLRHHVVQDHLAAGGCPVIEVTHWAAERPWCDQAVELLAGEFERRGYPELQISVSAVKTDPWTRGSGR
jgi:dinuclear metal center YbgI/SA1388 family protein